jgi:hypothetical protein
MKNPCGDAGVGDCMGRVGYLGGIRMGNLGVLAQIVGDVTRPRLSRFFLLYMAFSHFQKVNKQPYLKALIRNGMRQSYEGPGRVLRVL